MKKLMIGAAVAAITVGAFAGACDETVLSTCRAWDVKMNLKTLGPKKTKCTIAAESVCDDPTTDMVYYMDNVTRKLKGYLWICDYVCDDELTFNVVLWDEKNKKAIIAAPHDDGYQQVAATEVYAYGKKANKVAGNIAFEGTDALGEDAIAVNATGVSGKIVKGDQDDDCYIKSLSGYAAGLLAYIKPNSVVAGGTSATLCGEPVEPEICDEYLAKLIPFCEACCFTSWCDTEDAPDLVPAAGTWSMKYNKKVSKGGKSIQALVPSYAL